MRTKRQRRLLGAARGRRTAARYRGMILGGAVFLVMLVVPSTSYAWSQFFSCGVLAPGGAHCQSGGPHSLDRAQSWYPGPAAHHVRTCVYIWNQNSNPPQVRGGVVNCEWSDGAGTRIADVAFGPTTAIQYRAYSYNAPQTCCAHTVDGWTKTTY